MLVALFVFPLNSWADDPGTMSGGGGNGNPSTLYPPGKKPRTPVIEITCYALNGLMWFEYDSDAEGCLDITVTQRGTGSSINVVVCDNTPFAIPFNSGILDVTCYTEAGDEYTGPLLLCSKSLSLLLGDSK